ncbi:Uroporphyrinogen decarboxylase [Morus notabilis]|uniref:Uroporphyrinogen decarboxylase n=1 Tax=Morus notabilis TaxID=981085 RepID=W9QXH5_9ROSA|nr:Uroporphyrinogen decarboxylase [Morus notabilis]
MEFSASQVAYAGSLFARAFFSPVKYPIFPRPRIYIQTDYDQRVTSEVGFPLDSAEVSDIGGKEEENKRRRRRIRKKIAIHNQPIHSQYLAIISENIFSDFPQVLHALLQKFATSMAKYVQYQADNGAQAVQIFDSWATELSPVDFEEFSLPYLKQIVDTVRKTHPNIPLILYASGSGGLLERLALTGVDVVSLDWTVDMAEGRRRLGQNIAVQGNIDPGVLFGSKDFITDRINDTVKKAGRGKHILNLGHGIVVGTPEENVAHFFEVAKGIRY